MQELRQSVPLDAVTDAHTYAAIYLAGGHGAMGAWVRASQQLHTLVAGWPRGWWCGHVVVVAVVAHRL